MGRRQHSVHNSCRWGIGLAGSLDWLGKEKGEEGGGQSLNHVQQATSGIEIHHCLPKKTLLSEHYFTSNNLLTIPHSFFLFLAEPGKTPK
jgi:hypothetical protein